MPSQISSCATVVATGYISRLVRMVRLGWDRTCLFCDIAASYDTDCEIPLHSVVGAHAVSDIYQLAVGRLELCQCT